MTGFSEKVAVVTGALGIGQAAAKKLATEGASVVICSDREDSVEEVAEELRGENLEVRGCRRT
jgi:NAD(P)-dependent dehydrogenase (short-subunit alcohol dehydrogenase family)